MEEKDLLKERLQAITDKRRIQEYIAKKRREIEEEKLKLQYIKKKALREQWLMDGLCQQSEEEQEAMRLQAEDEKQQSDQLQSNIDRIEKEIVALETEEQNISANEEFILKRLKEVEKTPEDIIKGGMAGDIMEAHVCCIRSGRLVIILPCPVPASEPFMIPDLRDDIRDQLSATFAMEISVEHDKRTGTSQVVSAATVTPENIEKRGLKVFDDGRKSIYALNPDGESDYPWVNSEMTSQQAEELLRQATDETSCSGLDEKHMNSSTNSLVTVKVSSEEKLKPLQLICKDINGSKSSENFDSSNIVNDQKGRLESSPVTMIFMGYENALDEDDVDFQAELVTVGCSDDEEEFDYDETTNDEECLSYHPEGYKSKVFQPENADTTWNHLGLLRPTFVHKRVEMPHGSRTRATAFPRQSGGDASQRSPSHKPSS
nr:palmdelphin-like [Nerophis lumbriciformis]